MPDKKLTDVTDNNVGKMTDSEIVKGLRSWLEEIQKHRQAYSSYVGEEHYPSMRYEYLLSDTIHEINRLQAENERLKERRDKWKQIAEDFDKASRDTEKEIEGLQAENEKLKTNEERYNRIYHLLLDPLIVANGKNGELRPVKRTSRQDVYHTLLRAQEIMGIPYRWFPWKKDGDNK